MMRKFGKDMKDSKGSYAKGVRLGNSKSAKWLHRASGGRCEMGEVEGNMPKMNLGKPGRKHGGKVAKMEKKDDDEDDAYAKGGRVKRAGGGMIEGDDPAHHGDGGERDSRRDKPQFSWQRKTDPKDARGGGSATDEDSPEAKPTGWMRAGVTAKPGDSGKDYARGGKIKRKKG